MKFRVGRVTSCAPRHNLPSLARTECRALPPRPSSGVQIANAIGEFSPRSSPHSCVVWTGKRQSLENFRAARRIGGIEMRSGSSLCALGETWVFRSAGQAGRTSLLWERLGAVNKISPRLQWRLQISTSNHTNEKARYDSGLMKIIRRYFFSGFAGSGFVGSGFVGSGFSATGLSGAKAGSSFGGGGRISDLSRISMPASFLILSK